MEGWRVASKGLRALPRIKRGALGHGCGREGSGALLLPREAAVSTGLRLRRGGDGEHAAIEERSALREQALEPREEGRVVQRPLRRLLQVPLRDGQRAGDGEPVAVHLEVGRAVGGEEQELEARRHDDDEQEGAARDLRGLWHTRGAGSPACSSTAEAPALVDVRRRSPGAAMGGREGTRKTKRNTRLLADLHFHVGIGFSHAFHLFSLFGRIEYQSLIRYRTKHTSL